MDYFWMRADKRYLNPPKLINLESIVPRRNAMTQENASNIPDVSVGFTRSEKALDYLDVLDEQLFLVNDEVKKVFAMYETSMPFKTICILNNRDGSYCTYHAPLFQCIDCLPPKYKPIKERVKLERLIVEESAIQDHAVFKIAGTEIVLIRLDVAESLLRRGLKKYTLERVAFEDSTGIG